MQSKYALTFLTLDKADEVEEGAKVDLVRFVDNEDIAEFILKFLSEGVDEDDVILEKLRRRKNNNKVFFLPKFHYYLSKVLGWKLKFLCIKV